MRCEPEAMTRFISLTIDIKKIVGFMNTKL